MDASVSQCAHLARLIRAGVVVCLGLTLAACQRAPAPVTILAASSLQDVVAPLVAQIEAGQGVAVRTAYAASSTLARQIQAGAPADIFLSADVRWMDELQREQRIDPAARVELIGNTLVLITHEPDHAPVDLQQLATVLDGERRLALADPAHVPAGRYARAALERAGVWEQVAVRAVFADNVRAALMLVARGEASFGVVYATDVVLAPQVTIAAHFPPSDEAPIRYSFALLADAHPEARTVFRSLTDTRALEHFAAAGFVLP